MKIGIDMDDVLADFFPYFLDFYNKSNNKNFSLNDITDFHIWKVGIGKDKQEAIKIVDEFHDSLEYDKILPVSGSQKTLSQLSNKKLFIITSRPLKHQEKTNAFLQKHFPNISFTIYYTNDFHNGTSHTKADICQKLGINVLIEDCLAYAQACAEKGIIVFLLDKPWNQKENLPKNIIRINNWNEILEQINKLPFIT